MTAYVIYEAVVTDAEQYERYKTAAAPSVSAAGGRYVVRGGEVESFEGAAPARVVILEFPTLDAAGRVVPQRAVHRRDVVARVGLRRAHVRGRRHALTSPRQLTPLVEEAAGRPVGVQRGQSEHDRVEWYEILAVVRLATLVIRSMVLQGFKGDDWIPFTRLAYDRLGWSR